MTGPADDEDDRGGSPACFLHEVIGGHVVDADTWRDVSRFRKAERARLYEARRRLSVADRAGEASRIAAALDDLIGDVSGAVLSLYWPIRGEPDLRGWAEALAAQGAILALPVVVEKARPLAFHRWSPGAAMKRGVWNIPVPAEERVVTPDIVIAPLVGVDAAGYRLGNGGGYFDMTLAALAGRPRVIGVGQGGCSLPSIFPQPWDVPMDISVLGDGALIEGPQRR